MKYFQKNTTAKNTTRIFRLKCFRNITAGKRSQIKKGIKILRILPKAATHPTKSGKANSKKRNK